MYAVLNDNHVLVKDEDAHNLYNKRYYGNLTSFGLELSLVEAVYLQEKNKIEIYNSDDVALSNKDLYELLHQNKLYSKYLVYKDLRFRGYIIKTGFKYGSDYRIYERGSGPGDEHASKLVKILSEEQSIKALDFSSYVRVSHGVRKSLLLAVVDDEYDITYYDVEWTKP
ncbi:MAG: tRNA-intron lyase [Methanosphaera sp.]|nr:tRNA-intron lyase [Methanosphaera sp.]